MRFSMFCRWQAVLFISILFCSCNHSPKLGLYVHDKKILNYLIYMAADNNLERFAIKNIKALQKIGSSKNVNILVLFDRSPGYDKSEDNRTGSDLFYITENPKNMNDDIICEFEELDMTDSENLYDFLKTANEFFPSDRIVLDIWSHGRGVYPDGIIAKGVVEDYTTGYGAANTMAICDLANASRRFENETAKKLDIIHFDCCDMQMVEIAYQLKGLTDYVVGAETEIPGSGSDYKSIAEYLKSTEYKADELSSFLVESFYDFQKNSSIDFACSALKTSAFSEFVVAFNSFCDSLIFVLNEKQLELKSIRDDLLPTDSAYAEFVDFVQFANSCSSLGLDASVLMNAYSSLVPVSFATDSLKGKFGGLGINFPHTEKERGYYVKSDANNDIFDFYSDTKWDEFLSVYWLSL